MVWRRPALAEALASVMVSAETVPSGAVAVLAVTVPPLMAVQAEPSKARVCTSRLRALRTPARTRLVAPADAEALSVGVPRNVPCGTARTGSCRARWLTRPRSCSSIASHAPATASGTASTLRRLTVQRGGPSRRAASAPVLSLLSVTS